MSPNAFQSLKWFMLETNGGGANQTNYTPKALSGAKHLHWARGCNARKGKTQFLKWGARMLWQARQCKPHVWWHRWENLQGAAISLSPKSQDLAQSLESRDLRINDLKSRLCPGWWQKPQTTSLFTKEPEGDTQFICLLLLSCSHAGSITGVCAVKYTPTHSQNVCAAVTFQYAWPTARAPFTIYFLTPNLTTNRVVLSKSLNLPGPPPFPHLYK